MGLLRVAMPMTKKESNSLVLNDFKYSVLLVMASPSPGLTMLTGLAAVGGVVKFPKAVFCLLGDSWKCLALMALGYATNGFKPGVNLWPILTGPLRIFDIYYR